MTRNSTISKRGRVFRPWAEALALTMLAAMLASTAPDPKRLDPQDHGGPMIKNTFLAAVLGGVIGGIAGAYLAMHLARGAIAVQSVLAVPAQSRGVVSASRVELRDTDGRVRAELAMSVDGGPALFFFDTAGKNRLVVGLYSPGRRRSSFAGPERSAAARSRHISPLWQPRHAGAGTEKPGT